MFKVQGLTFKNFNEVLEWAWNTHKLDEGEIEAVTLEQQLQATKELDVMISDFMVENTKV